MLPVKNIQAHPLVERSIIILLALHINLRIMKQFVKALDTDVDCFRYIQSRRHRGLWWA